MRITILNISLFLLFGLLNPLLNFAQPGPDGGELRFKVFSPDFGYISPDNSTFKITIENQSSLNLNEELNEKFYYSYDYQSYVFIPHKTPVGGLVFEDFCISIINSFDTMLVYPPLKFRYELINFDSIPFKSGKYYIPDHIYNFDNDNIKTIPNINGSWDFFKNPAPSVFLELIDTLTKSEDKIIELYGKKLVLYEISNTPKKSYQYGNLLLINEYTDIFTIYKIEEIVDSTLFGGNIYDFLCDTIIYNNNHYYAMGVRQFGGIANTHYICGIFKLYLDKNITKKETVCLTYKYYLDEEVYLIKSQSNKNKNYINEYSIQFYLDEFPKRLNSFKELHNIKSCF